MSLPKRPQAQRSTASAAQVRRRSDLMPGLPTGYQDQETGEVRALQGDEVNAWFKDPVHIDEPRAYNIPSPDESGQPYVIPLAESISELTTYPEIDVRAARQLTLFIQVFSNPASGPGADSTLAIFPETASVLESAAEPTWFFYGVVNPVLYGSGLYGATAYASLESNSTAFRDCFVSQLNFTPESDNAAGTPRNIQLTFDVSDKTLVRFRFGTVWRGSDEPPELDPMRVKFFYQLQK